MSRDHLGGHRGVCNIDRGLVLWMKDRLYVRTMVDVGCGTGGMLALAEAEGVRSHGIDGDDEVERGAVDVRIHDFSVGPPALGDKDDWDAAYSCEFLEHVHERALDAVFSVFGRCKWVVVTAAPPGWGGHHHVNERDHEYWIREFNARGFVHVPQLTREARDASTMNSDLPPAKRFVAHRALVFVNARRSCVEDFPEKVVVDGEFDVPKLPVYVERRDPQHDAVRLISGVFFRSTLPLVGLVTEDI